jgi:ankyrin repeat protein
MNLLDLPNELIVSIANCLKQSTSLSRFARTNRHVYSLVMPLLHQHNIKYGGCSGLQAQLTPLDTKNSTSQFFTEINEDLEEYKNPSDLTTPEGLPIPVTDEIRVRDIVIGEFVKQGVNLNTVHQVEYEQEESLLHYHAAVRNSPAVFLLAKHGADVHAPSGYEERTALHWAALGGCAKIVRFLIKKGVDVNARDWEEKTPVHFAAAEGHVAAIRLLFENGADINAQDEFGYTPLHLMMMNGKPAPDSWCIPALKAMLELGPNTELGVFEDNKTPLHVAILNQRDIDFLETLLESGIDLNSRTVEGRTPLSCCVERGDMRLFMMLLKAGADIHSRDEDGRSLLQIALEDEDRAYGCLPTLLETGVSALDSDAGGGTILVQFLKERGWLYTIKNRVDCIPEIDELESD